MSVIRMSAETCRTGRLPDRLPLVALQRVTPNRELPLDCSITAPFSAPRGARIRWLILGASRRAATAFPVSAIVAGRRQGIVICGGVGGVVEFRRRGRAARAPSRRMIRSTGMPRTHDAVARPFLVAAAFFAAARRFRVAEAFCPAALRFLVAAAFLPATLRVLVTAAFFAAARRFLVAPAFFATARRFRVAAAFLPDEVAMTPPPILLTRTPLISD
jgi:hypothetical protein